MLRYTELRDDATGKSIVRFTGGWDDDFVSHYVADFYDCWRCDVGFVDTDDGEKATVFGEPVASIAYAIEGTSLPQVKRALPEEVASENAASMATMGKLFSALAGGR